MKRRAIIKELSRIKETKARLRANRSLLKRTAKAVKIDCDLLDDLKDVIIVDGQPVNVWSLCNSTHINAIADEHQNRSGQVYLNAHNEKTFGVRLRRPNKVSGWERDEVFAGAYWRTKSEAMQAVYDWVFHAILPKKNGSDNEMRVKFFWD